MKLLDYKRYFKQELFDLENKKLFSKLWVYGCSIADLPEHNSYYLAQMPFGEILITREEENLHAFHNKCLHRGHPIVTKQRGTAVFTCPYHNWCFNNKGGLTHIPGDERFYGTIKDEYTFEELQRVSVKRLGDFIFINADLNPIDISAQFDTTIIESLEKTRDKLNTTNLFLSIPLDFNWKLIFENLRDPLHPLYLHPSSLTQEVDFYATEKNPEINDNPIKDLVEISSYSRDGDLRNSNPPYKKEFLMCDNGENYLNWLLFPFTHIPSPDGGVLYGVENYVPLSAEKTRFDLHLYITKSTGKVPPLAVLYDWLMKAKIVLKEDFDAICLLQKNIKQSEQEQNLGNYELQNLRINQFLDHFVYEKNS